MTSIVDDAKSKMLQALDHLQTDLKGIRTGHANSAMLDTVTVEAYGTQMKIRDLGNITTPEPRQIVISPYDAQNAGPIGKAIEKANLGFNPVVEANQVRIIVPPMDEAMRKEMVKVCHRKLEEAKVSIRNSRREANDEVRNQKSKGDLSEDDMHRFEKEIQQLTDNYCKQADAYSEKKEKEVMTI